jgi:membrane peptidoglycan carboxypeptidase
MAALIRTATIAGLVVAAVSFPFAAIAGLTAKVGADEVTTSSEQLRDTAPAQVTKVYASDGTTLITQFFEEYRAPVPLAAMALGVRQAIVAAEDARFYDHHGVDLKGVARAFVANRQAGSVSQGASTLTMQYVRNAMRDSARTPDEALAATERTPARKFREIRLAISLEGRLSKDQILERYLNVAYFGHRAYGISAAAEIYFSKRPADLTLAESATLAGLVQAPSSYDPALNPNAAVERRNYVLDRMTELGYVDAPESLVAKGQSLTLKLSNPANDCSSVNSGHNDWGFFCDFFKSWWMRQPVFGTSPEERLDTLRRGGYSVITSLDPKVQAAAREHLVDKEKTTSSFAHGMVTVEPGTGRVTAMAVNRVYSLDQSGNGPSTVTGQSRALGSYPNTVAPLLGGGDLPGYQAGSTFKMFTMLAALEQASPLSTNYFAPRSYRSIYPSGRGEPASCGGRWCPSNASGKMTGKHTMWSGFGQSVNTYFVQVEQKAGADKVVGMAQRLGLQWHTDIDRLQSSPAKAAGWGAFTLGVADTTPLEMASAYATVAADGRYCAPSPIRSITGPGGTAVKGAEPQCRQSVAREVARAAADAARCTTGYKSTLGDCGSWSTAPRVYPLVGRPVAGKTGTTDSTRAAWFVGFTPQLAAASFIADPDNPFHRVGDANSWKPVQSVGETLRDALAGTPVVDFTPPPTSLVGPPKPLPAARAGDTSRH